MTTPELLPCPFCGEQGEMDGTTWRPTDGKEVGWITCNGCNAYGPTLPKIEAIAAWNTRAPLSPDAIAALPAQGVRLRPLEWIDFEGRGAKAQAWNEANYMVQKWSDGRWEISASYPGYSTFIEGTDRFYLTLDAAKAAAQADYERRILAALAPAEAGGVEAPAEDATAKGETDGETLERLGMDGAKWAAEFRTTALRLGYSDMDEGWLVGWFCNAIMAGYDRAPSPAPVDALVKAAEELLSAVDTYAETPPQSSAEALASCDVATAAEEVRAALAAIRGEKP